MAKGLKLNAKKFWVLIPTFVEVAGVKLVCKPFGPPAFIQNKKFLSEKILKNYKISIKMKSISSISEFLDVAKVSMLGEIKGSAT